jgi:hypothetical protein
MCIDIADPGHLDVRPAAEKVGKLRAAISGSNDTVTILSLDATLLRRGARAAALRKNVLRSILSFPASAKMVYQN